MISFPVRVKWRDESGKEVVQDGLTENVGLQGTLIYLPRKPAARRRKGKLDRDRESEGRSFRHCFRDRRERNAAHPRVALQLVDGMRDWKKKVWEYAGSIIAAQEPEPLDDL